ncbi:hypothetical protein [Allorhizocola rhizosphaerae]|uniref:hypothetical protein n=1 Tax=Allorhizocola rhizosphaerae TaxID=1872709 RepID=UPI001FE9AB3D|nr:hypothetical protein [Allorhizocola rhizosphaerae]
MDSSFRRRVGQTGNLNVGHSDHQATTPSPLTRDLRRPRHAGLIEAVHRLDAEISQAARGDLARWIRDQYQTEVGDIPLGFVAKCHLGPPYVDHILDLFDNIVDHYAPADPMPEPFSKARMLVRTNAYAYIEIYGSGEIRPVYPDGTVVV